MEYVNKYLALLKGWSILEYPTVVHTALVLWFLSLIRVSPRPITAEPPCGVFFKRLLQFIALLQLAMNCVVFYTLVNAYYGHKRGEFYNKPTLEKMAASNEYFVWLQIIGLLEMLLHIVRGCDKAGNTLWFRASVHYFKFVVAWNVAKSTPAGSNWLANAMQLEDCTSYLLVCLVLLIGYLVRGHKEYITRDGEPVQQLCVPYKTYLTELVFFQAVTEMLRVPMSGMNKTLNLTCADYLFMPLLLTLCLFLKRINMLKKIAEQDFGTNAVEPIQHIHQD